MIKRVTQRAMAAQREMTVLIIKVINSSSNPMINDYFTRTLNNLSENRNRSWVGSSTVVDSSREWGTTTEDDVEVGLLHGDIDEEEVEVENSLQEVEEDDAHSHTVEDSHTVEEQSFSWDSPSWNTNTSPNITSSVLSPRALVRELWIDVIKKAANGEIESDTDAQRNKVREWLEGDIESYTSNDDLETVYSQLDDLEKRGQDDIEKIKWQKEKCLTMLKNRKWKYLEDLLQILEGGASNERKK